MAYKIYVGGLPYSTTDEELQELFATHGAVASARVIIDRMSGRSKGFGFVELENDEDGDKAVSALDGTDFGGRKLVVSKARPQEERPRDGGFRGGDRGCDRGGDRGGFGRRSF